MITGRRAGDQVLIGQICLEWLLELQQTVNQSNGQPQLVSTASEAGRRFMG
jgi:hypothetical protein